MAFYDTSVLVAAFDEEHLHHRASFRSLEGAEIGSAACAAHTLAELYAVVSRLPGTRRQRPAQAWLLVQNALERLTVVALTSEEYAATIRKAADDGHAGGMVYDALLLQCARKAKAGKIYTWNVRHFRAIAPDLAERIGEP